MAQTCEMKLLGAAGSVFVTRVKFALKLKCIEYEYIEEDLRNKSELLLTSNPIIQHVPVFFHANKQPVIESLAILEYLDEIQPYVYPLLPSNPSDRAQCRILAYTFDTQVFYDPCHLKLCHPLMKELIITQEGERREELKRLIIERFVMLEEAFVKLSKGKAYFGGDDIGYLDIVIGSFLGWFKFNETIFGLKMIDEARTPKLTKWRDYNEKSNDNKEGDGKQIQE
ncbi:glutathione S-transferase U16-like [Bidens hawaiensis]|uniref:glutathione S-transferase U16-like n=1 Tax=Bidens hawaiensis TaxID=980011 RepID=UPI00404A1BFD